MERYGLKKCGQVIRFCNNGDELSGFLITEKSCKPTAYAQLKYHL
jgi:hypothetical protein